MEEESKNFELCVTVKLTPGLPILASISAQTPPPSPVSAGGIASSTIAQTLPPPTSAQTPPPSPISANPPPIALSMIANVNISPLPLSLSLPISLAFFFFSHSPFLSLISARLCSVYARFETFFHT